MKWVMWAGQEIDVLSKLMNQAPLITLFHWFVIVKLVLLGLFKRVKSETIAAAFFVAVSLLYIQSCQQQQQIIDWWRWTDPINCLQWTKESCRASANWLSDSGELNIEMPFHLERFCKLFNIWVRWGHWVYIEIHCNQWLCSDIGTHAVWVLTVHMSEGLLDKSKGALKRSVTPRGHR